MSRSDVAVIEMDGVPCAVAPIMGSMGIDVIARHAVAMNRPRVVVGVSGFGGSGKSTLAAALQQEIESSTVVGADEFIVGQALARGDDWPTIDRHRMREQLLHPYRAEGVASYQVYDWTADRPGAWRPVDCSCLILEGVGLFHPDLLPLLDLRIWVECPPNLALERAVARDRAQGHDNRDLWETLWAPNDVDFHARFSPVDQADYLYDSTSADLRSVTRTARPSKSH